MHSPSTHRVQGLYGIADAACSNDDPVRLAAMMLEGGCKVIQLRCKTWNPSDIEHAARVINRRCRTTDALFFVNDYVEIAAAVGAHGVHVGQTDTRSTEIREKFGNTLLIGRSTNALHHIPAAIQDADYLAFGPIFHTHNLSRTKPTQGLELLTKARALVTGRPLVAIGGITKDRLPDIRATGVDAWAVISAIASADDPIAATKELCD